MKGLCSMLMHCFKWPLSRDFWPADPKKHDSKSKKSAHTEKLFQRPLQQEFEKLI
jgi:hypothetical protein